MEEAERLCDRVAIIDHGRIVDIGTPAELVARHCPERIGDRRRRTTRRRSSGSGRFRASYRSRVAAAIAAGSSFAAAATTSSRRSSTAWPSIASASPISDRSADARRRVPQADRPRDPRLSGDACDGLLRLTWLEIEDLRARAAGAVRHASAFRCWSSCWSRGCSARRVTSPPPDLPRFVTVDLPIFASLLIAAQRRAVAGDDHRDLPRRRHPEAPARDAAAAARRS